MNTDKTQPTEQPEKMISADEFILLLQKHELIPHKESEKRWREVYAVTIQNKSSKVDEDLESAVRREESSKNKMYTPMQSFAFAEGAEFGANWQKQQSDSVWFAEWIRIHCIESKFSLGNYNCDVDNYSQLYSIKELYTIFLNSKTK